MSAKFHLKLYVTGVTEQSRRAQENLRAICAAAKLTEYQLEVIDILEDPAEAERNKILATPTLMKVQPSPVCKIIGDLSDREKVMLGLNLKATS